MEEKKRILKMVQEGKLTMEEALMMFERLDEQKSNIGFICPSFIRMRIAFRKNGFAEIFRFLDTDVIMRIRKRASFSANVEER